MLYIYRTITILLVFSLGGTTHFLSAAADPDIHQPHAKRAKIECFDHTPTTLIDIAHGGCKECINNFIKSNADIDQTNELGQTALMIAACNGQSEIVDLLIEKRASIDKTCAHTHSTALMYATNNGHKETTSLLLDRNASINIQGDQEFTPLLIAEQENHGNIVRLLLDRKALVDQPGPGKATPLIRAAIHGHTAVASLLLNRNAAIDRQDQYGVTALIHASRTEYLDTATYLIGEGAALNIEDSCGATALTGAVIFNKKAMVSLLLDNKAAVNRINKEGRTALMLATHHFPENSFTSAVAQERLTIIQNLLQAGADYRLRDPQSRSAFDCIELSNPPNFPVYDKFKSEAKKILTEHQMTHRQGAFYALDNDIKSRSSSICPTDIHKIILQYADLADI